VTTKTVTSSGRTVPFEYWFTLDHGRWYLEHVCYVDLEGKWECL